MARERPLGGRRSVTMVRDAMEFFRYPMEHARNTIHTRKKTVSSEDQNEERQKIALGKYNIEKWFIDKKSGKNMDREDFQKMMLFIRNDSDDVVYVSELSRLARSTLDLYNIMEVFNAKGVQLVSDKESIDTSTPTGRAMFGFMAVMAQFERELIHERQAEGIAAAKAAGKHIGRPFRKYDKEEFDKLFKRYQERLITITDIGKKLGLSRATVYRLIEVKKKEILNDIQ